MTASVDEHLESLKELWLTDSDLSFLRSAEPALLARIVDEVRANRERLEADQRALYATLARATRFLPNFLVAKISSGMSAYVLARVTEQLDPKIAGQLSKAYEPALLAEISLHLEAETVAQIAVHIPIDALVTLTETLANKGLYRRLGEVSDALEESLFGQLLDRMGDPERIASMAAHMTASNSLASAASRLDATLLQAVVRVLQTRGHVGAAAALAR